jgi:glycosyltransferase involved in cell wall biosynthesis
MRIGVMLRTLDEKGGVGVYSRNLLETLLEIDDRNEYELFYRSAQHLGTWGSRANVREHVLHARGKALWDQVAVPRACRRQGVDVLLHPKFTLPLFTQVPCVMVVHGADWFLPDAARFYKPLDRAYMRLLMPRYLHKARVVISVSQITTDDFVRIFRLPVAKVQTVYFGPAANFRRVTDPDRLEAVRRKYRLPQRFILTLSKVGGDTRKNIGGVFEAYARVHGRVPHQLVVGGLGCERFREDYSLPTDGWGRDVLFPGYLDQTDLPAIYSLADLYLYPSNQEAFPIPLTEAMACGVPIVTSRANGLEEIAGDAAELVNPRDPDEIAAATCRVLTDPSLQRRLSRKGLERSRLFSWAACASRTLEILEHVARERPVRSRRSPARA